MFKIIKICFAIILAFSQIIIAKTDSRMDFIKSFIESEQKPTTVFTKLCWNNELENKLFKDLTSLGVRFTKSTKPARTFDQTLLFVTDLLCPEADKFILKASSEQLLRLPYRWLVFSNTSHEDTILDALPLLPDSEFVVVTESDDVYFMTELYKTSAENPMISTPRGYYNGSFYDVRDQKTLFGRRRNLMGHTLTKSNVIQDSNTTQYHLPREDRLLLEYDSISKMGWSAVKVAFLMLNATPNYIFSHRWGYIVNGSWSGMIDDLHSGRADVGTNCLAKDDRLPVVVYTDNLVPFRVRFIFRQPPLPYVANIFSLPFSTSVWVAVTVCTAVSAIALYAASSWEATVERSPTQLDGSLGDALLLTMSAVSQQGCFLEPKKASGRIMVWFLFAALMALYAAYSANIVVLLQAPSNAVRNLAQLAYSKITLAALDVDYNHFVFKANQDDRVRRDIFLKVDPDKGKKQFYELNDGVERIRRGLFAFHAITEPVYKRIEKMFLESEKCDLVEVDYLNNFDPFTPVKKGSPYLELLSVAFKRIRESGIRDALYKRSLTPKPSCTSKISSFSSVGLIDLKPVLLLMAFGIAISLAILFAEILVYKISRMRLKRRKFALHEN